eukprot:XP_014013939.1 PREDICTED: CUB domain-containing protein 1-like [Salmo salar]
MEFTCTKPEEVFTVEVVREIDCTTRSCNGDIIPIESRTRMLLLQNFNHTFIWNLKAPVPRAFHLVFTQMGLRQILPSERCPDQHTYTLLALQRTGEAAIGTIPEKDVMALEASDRLIYIHGTVELLPTTGSLRQSLPEQPCNGYVTLTVAEDNDGTTVGQFCPQGAIHKVQVHTNVSITASVSTMGGKEMWPFSYPLLISFTREIAGVPTLLATPSCPVGMKSYSTVSWIADVPSKLEAQHQPAQVQQPPHGVQILGSLEEMYSRREDEEAGRKITVSESFYLNMSICMPERGDFSVLTQITLHKDKRRRRDSCLTKCPSTTPTGPEHNGRFPKSRKDNESHIYASIEDTLVYSHLLRDGAEMGVYGDQAVDVYQSFTGPTETKPLSLGAVTERPEVGVYQPFVPPSHIAPPVPNGPLS